MDEFEQIPINSPGQESLECCSPWGCKESDMTEWLNIYIYKIKYYLALKENEVMYFAATWMDLEIIWLSEESQTEKDKLCDST